MEAKIRISYISREIEIEGSETFVREQLSNLSSTLEDFASTGSSVDSAIEEDYDAGTATSEGTAANQDTPTVSSKMPETFGEYLSQFPRDVHQDEQILISGYFAQCKSSEKAFTTKGANDFLKEQGIKVGNPSQSVTNGKNLKRIFATQKSKFRVSQSGVDHINSLRNG